MAVTKLSPYTTLKANTDSSMMNYRITANEMPGLSDSAIECHTSNYAFIKGPQELSGNRIDDPETQKMILTWLETERSKGHKLVGAFDTSLSWLFEVTPNSVRFITDD